MSKNVRKPYEVIVSLGFSTEKSPSNVDQHFAW